MKFVFVGDSTSKSLLARSAAMACTAFLLVAVPLIAGCEPKKSAPGAKRGPAAQTGGQGALFDSVVDNLDHLEQFETEQIIKQICDRLNQWYLQDKPQVAWQLDPLVGTLPEDLRNLQAVKILDAMQYRQADGWYLQESVWMRDVSKTARGDQFSDLAVAEKLFDWTVRNLQLDSDVRDPKAPRHLPSICLLLGHAQAAERAWVFSLLARQQGLDVVLLGLSDDPSRAAQPWVAALLSEGQLYLFDCRLGLPIPGPDGKGVATLAQVVEDDKLLRHLDLDSEHPYPVKSEDLKNVIAYVEGSPMSLSKRMALVESRLAGKHKMALTSPATAVAERVKKSPHVAQVKLWPYPFEVARWQSQLDQATMQQAAREMGVFERWPSLMTGRALHFKGQFEGEQGAKFRYLEMRVSDKQIENFKLPPDIAAKVRRDALSQVEASHVVLLRQAKADASYWLGLVLFEQGDYPSAIDLFDKRTLQAKHASQWSSGARYNLGRTQEAAGNIDAAAAAYDSDDGPQSHGNHLRAKWLKERVAAKQASAE